MLENCQTGKIGLDLVKEKRLQKGILIAIEGIDGAGKTTQTRLLVARLAREGYPTRTFHEPTNGQWGKKIKRIAEHGRQNVDPKKELEFFHLDRREDVETNIAPSLQKKNIVIMDRYLYSSVAYQGALGIDPHEIYEINKEFAPIPDVTIILDITPRIAIERIRHGRKEIPNHFERKENLKKVRRIFLEFIAPKSEVRVLKGDRNEEIIAKDIWNLVAPLIQEVEVIS